VGGDQSRSRKLWHLLVLVGGAAAVVLFILWLWLPSQLGDPAKEFLVVANRTDVRLQIVQVATDGTTSEISEVAPSSSVETYLPCASAPLEALDPEGTVMASRPGSEECNLEVWIIE
jgi:hypothetical protein